MLFVFLAATIGGTLRKGQAAPDLSAYPWLYLRDDEPLAADEKVIELIAVGDVMVGRDVADKVRPLVSMAPWLRAADLTLGNLECVIAEEGVPRPGPYRLRALPSAVAELRNAGFDVLGLANNHALDFGTAGLAETVSRLQEAGIATVGIGPNAEAAIQPLIRRVGGVRLALLAFNAVPDPEDVRESDGWTRAGWDRAQATAAITAARAQADAVIVSVHWGYEYELRADPAQRDAAQAMLGAGADLVIGHHPHVVQGTELDLRGLAETSEVSSGRFVAYSLGNFVFDQQQGETRQGLALRAFFDGQGLRAVQALPVWAGPHPRLMTPDEATSLWARIQPPRRKQDGLSPHRLGFACDSQTCRPVNVPQASKTGSFRSGAIDLTGDGVAEQVRLEEQQVIVYCDGVETWRGLPGWCVVDLALGDPNDDGRNEMLLALWKPDAAGVPRDSTEASTLSSAEALEVSHPFIIGYREGAYRILWGGSAVADPIHEVELGDVDGDSAQELIVLEERDDGCAVTVWRWHGWGFSLMWRSPPGHYRDLALITSGDSSPSVTSVAVGSCERDFTLNSYTWSSTSPDGQWVAEGMMEGPFLVGEDEQYRTQLKVTSADGTVQWTIVDETSHYGLGYTVPTPFHWSRDGRYLYFTNEPVPDGCALFVNGSDLQRVDLTDGRVTEIVPSGVWWLSLSPDEAMLAYLRWSGERLELILRELARGEERRAQLDAEYSQAGSIVWSPDGTALMLTLASSPCDPVNWTQSVVRVDLATMLPTTLIRDDGRLFVTVEWPEAGRVLLRDKDGNSWWMDAMTGQVTMTD